MKEVKSAADIALERVASGNLDPMEEMFDKLNYPQEALVKINIPHANIAPLLDSVLSVGFTDSVAYPDLEGLAMEIKRSFGFAF